MSPGGPRAGGASIEIVVNGTATAVPARQRVVDLLADLDRDPRLVAIERNGEILPRARFAETVLVAGDRLEIVQFVQGG